MQNFHLSDYPCQGKDKGQGPACQMLGSLSFFYIITSIAEGGLDSRVGNTI